MQLRTPKRYKRQRRRLFGSWRWLRNLILLGALGYFAYWLYNNQDLARQRVEEMRGEIGEMQSDLATRIPQQPTPTKDVSDALVEANAAYQTGDFRRAIERYTEVIAGQPNNLEAHYRLALLLIITSDLGVNKPQLEQAVAVANKAINAAPESPEGWTIKAMALAWDGDTGGAIANALQALTYDSQYVQAKAILAESYWRAERFELAQTTITEATDYLREVGSARPETVATVFRTQGYIAERQLDRETAIQAYETARSAAPTHSYIALELALSYFGAGQTTQAIDLLKAALDSNPRDASLLFQLGKIYVNIGDGENGQQTFQRCIEIDANFVPCRSWLGGLQYYAGNYTQAINNLQLAIELGSSDVEDWWQLGRAHANMLRCDLAIPVLREGYARSRGNPDLEDRFAGGLRDCGSFIEGGVPTPEALPTEAEPS